MVTKLEKKAGQKPLWSQVYEIIKDRIDTMFYTEGTNLPTETELMAEFSVSRVTIRQAMEALLRDGYISRRRGSGTIVLPSRRNASTTFRTTLLGEEHNDRKDRRVIAVSYEKAPEKARNFFKIPANQPVLRVERRSYIDNKPIANFVVYLNPMAAVADTADFGHSLYGVLEQAGYPITEIEERFTAALSTPPEEKIFKLQKNTAIFHRERYGYSGTHPIEYSLAQYNAADYEITISQKR